MRFWDEFKAEYNRRRDAAMPDDWPAHQRGQTDNFPRWNSYERRDIRSVIRSSNPVRFARLERDMVWLRRQCIKRGLDPDQARWLI